MISLAATKLRNLVNKSMNSICKPGARLTKLQICKLFVFLKANIIKYCCYLIKNNECLFLCVIASQNHLNVTKISKI